MSLTKKDKEEITEIFRNLMQEGCYPSEKIPKDKLPDFDTWRAKGIKSELLGRIVAPEDAFEGDKRFFTYDEALDYEKRVLEPNGWRLMTCQEQEILAAEFGYGEDGQPDAGKFIGVFYGSPSNLPGWIDCDEEDKVNGTVENQGVDGNWWSSTARSRTNAYSLYITYYPRLVPQNNYVRAYGFSVRCVSK